MTPGIYDLQLNVPGLAQLALAELQLTGINADAVQQRLENLKLGGLLIEAGGQVTRTATATTGVAGCAE